MSEFFRTTPPGLLTDDDAGFLASNWNAVPEPERFFYAAKLNEYQNFRQHYPRPLTPSEQAERRNERVRLGEIFTDFDKATQADGLSTLQFADAEQLPAIKQGLANRAFVQHLSGLEGDALERDYELARDALAKQMFGGTGVADDTAFHAKAAEWVQNENGKEEVTRSLIEAGRRAAAWEGSGLSESVRPSLMTWQEGQTGKPGYDIFSGGEYEKTFKAAQAEAKADFDRLRPYVDAAWLTLTGGAQTDVADAGAVDFEALADRLMELPAEDRRKTLAMVKARAELLPEKDQSGFWKNVSKAFRRQGEAIGQGMVNELPRITEGIGAMGGPARERQALYEDIRNLQRLDLDPIVSRNGWESAAQAVAGSLPGLAAMWTLSPWVMAGQFASDARQTVRTELEKKGVDPAVSGEFANGLALPAAVAMSYLEKVTLGMANGIPGVKQLQAKLLTRLSETGVKRALAVGGVFALEAVEQNVQEALQDTTPLLLTEVAETLGAPIPEVEAWGPAMQTMTDPSAWAVSLVFAGMGFGRMPDLEAAQILRERGASNEQIQTVLAAPDADTWRVAVTDALTAPANQPAGMDIETETAGQAVENAVAGVTSVTRDAEGWWVEHADGRRTKTDSVAAAQMLVTDLAQVNTQDEADAMVELADSWSATDPRARQTFTGEKVTAGPEGVFTSRDGQAPRLVPMTKETAAELDAELELLARAEGGDAAVTRVVAGSNSLEYRRNVGEAARTVVERLNAKQNVGGDVLTLVHERVEATWRAALESGTINMAETFRALRRLEEALGRAVLSEDPSEAEVRETVSEMVAADVLGRRKDGKRVPAGAISKGLTAAIESAVDPQERAALGKFRSFLRAVRAFWRNVFKTAAAIGKARREGKLKDGDEWSSFVDKLMGVDAQKAHEAAVAKAAGVELDTKSTFSLGRKVDSDTGAADKNDTPGGSKISEMSNPITVYRAGDADERGVKPWASFTTEKETAEAYTDNPGFGGSTIRTLLVDAGNMLDLTGRNWFVDLAEALGLDEEIAQDWKDSGWLYPWEESSKIKRALEESEFDSIQYPDDFPEGATTIVFTREVKWNEPGKAPQAGVEVDSNAQADKTSDTFSLSSATGLERLARQIANRPSTPRDKARIWNRMASDLAGMARSVNFNDAGADVLKQSEIRQKAKVMRVELAEKYETEVLEGGAGETLAAADLAKMRGQPFLAWLTDSTKGRRLQSRLMSRTRATREGRYDPDVNGDYDGAVGLPRWVFNGSQMPDQVAQAAFADGVLPDESVETLWQVIGNEIEQVQKWKQRVRQAEGRLMAAKRRAADEARAWETAEIARARNTREATRDADSRRALVIFDQMLMALPAEVRAQVGGFTRVADLKSNDARFKYFAAKVVEIDRVLEIHLRNQYLKELREVFIEGRPRMAAGEKDKGKIGVDGHAWLDEAERISKLSAADLEVEEAAVEKRMASPTLTENTINHYRKLFTFATDEAGARQALEQHEALLNLFGALTHRRDGGTDVRGRMIPGEPLRNAGEIYAALEAAREVVTTGRLDWFAEVIARRERRASLRTQAITDAGGPGSLDAVEGQAEDLRGVGSKFRNFVESHFSFEGFMSSVFGQDSATHKWADETSLASDLQYRDSMRARERALTGFLRSVWPRSNVRQRQKRLEQLATSREVPGAPAGVPRMSELDAVHFTMLWSDEDTASKEWLTAWGLGQDTQAALEAWLSDDAKAIRQWLASGYDSQYDEINGVFRRMYGVNLPRVKNYAPRLVDHGGNANEMQLDPLQEGRQLMAGFTKRRRIDVKSPPRQVDALTAYWQNAHAVEYWKAWSEQTADFRAVFSHYSTHAAVKSRWGNDTAASLNEWLGVLERNGVQNANGQGMIRRWTSAMADYALVGKLGVLAKQMVAGYASASQIGIPEFLRSVGRIARGEAAITLREMYRSDTVQRRMANLSPEARVATRGRGLTPIEGTLDRLLSRVGTDINALDNAQVWLRERIGAMDAFFTTLSAAAAYDTAYQEARAAGMPEADAREAAQARTDVVIADSAQPETVRDKSLGELRGGVMGRLLMPFQSANRQALAMTVLAAKQGRTGDALRMAAIHWMATGIVAQTIGNVMRSVLDDDDVEDIWEWEDYARAVVIGPLTGARFLGMAIEAAAPFFGGFERRQAAVPMSEGIRLLRQAVTGDFDFKSLTETMNGVALIVGGRATWVAIASNILKQSAGVADVLTWSPEETAERKAKQEEKVNKKIIKDYEKANPKPEKPQEQKDAEKARRRAREAARAEAIRQGEPPQ